VRWLRNPLTEGPLFDVDRVFRFFFSFWRNRPRLCHIAYITYLTHTRAPLLFVLLVIRIIQIYTEDDMCRRNTSPSKRSAHYGRQSINVGSGGVRIRSPLQRRRETTAEYTRLGFSSARNETKTTVSRVSAYILCVHKIKMGRIKPARNPSHTIMFDMQTNDTTTRTCTPPKSAHPVAWTRGSCAVLNASIESANNKFEV